MYCKVVFWKAVSSKWFKELCKNLKDLDQMQINTDKLFQNRNQIKFDTRKRLERHQLQKNSFSGKLNDEQ